MSEETPQARPELQRVAAAPQASTIPLLPYAPAQKPLPLHRKPFSAEASAIIAGIVVFAATAWLDQPVVFALGEAICAVCFLIARMGRPRNIPRGWSILRGLVSMWPTAWGIYALVLVATWRGWPEYMWVYNPPLQWTTLLIVVGVMATAICEVLGKHSARRQLKNAAHVPSSGTPGEG